MLRLDPVTKINIDLMKRYRAGTPCGDLEWKNNPAAKRYILGEIARLRIWSQSDIALDKLEAWADKYEVDMFEWPHG